MASEASLAAFGTNADESRELYDQWSSKYDAEVRSWGYDTPEQVATVLTKHLPLESTGGDNRPRVLDAGAGSGISGQALRNRIPCLEKSEMMGLDISEEMLQEARTKGCYTSTQVVNLSETPLPFESNSYDIVICVGTLTYLEPRGHTLSDFVRICRSGGLICYTNRTDKMSNFDEEVR